MVRERRNSLLRTAAARARDCQIMPHRQDPILVQIDVRRACAGCDCRRGWYLNTLNRVADPHVARRGSGASRPDSEGGGAGDLDPQDG